MQSSLSNEAVRSLASTLQQLAGRERAAAKREFLAAYGVSASTLSRALHELGLKSHQRSDRGVRRKAVADESLSMLVAIQRASDSLRKGVIMPAADAIEIAEDSGLIDTGLVSEAYYNKWLRDQGVSRQQQKAADPHITLRSLGPNHVHQVDFSLAVNWKIFQGKPTYEHLVYKNKLPSAGTPRLWRLIVVDHATNCFATRYIQTTGETVIATLEGLYYAWSAKTLAGESIEKKYPFRGVPRILMADRGSANQANITSSILSRLGVELHICEAARSKGSVESSHNWWEEHFEARLRLQQPASVEQLNDWAVDFAVKMCGNAIHTRFGSTRSTMWSWHINRKPETQLRELRCDWETFRSIAVSDPQECTVKGNKTIRFKGQSYRVPAEAQTGTVVMVQFSPFEYPRITVRLSATSEQAWICDPVVLDEFGFPVDAPVIGASYQSHKKSTMRTAVDAANVASKELIAAQNLRVFGHHAEKAPDVQVRNMGSDALELQQQPEASFTKVQARAMVIDAIARPFTTPEREYINSTFGEAVSQAEIDAAIDRVEAGITARVITFGAQSA
jgi:transposase InsO family protein